MRIEKMHIPLLLSLLFTTSLNSCLDRIDLNVPTGGVADIGFEPTRDFKFVEGYHFKVITETVDENTYSYFEKIKQILSLSGSMFDPPAAKITGNMVNLTNEEATVYGYFYATEQDTMSQFIEPTTGDVPDFFCLRPFSGMPPETCIDCTVWRSQGDGVAVIRPDFWPKNR